MTGKKQTNLLPIIAGEVDNGKAREKWERVRKVGALTAKYVCVGWV